MVEEHVGFSPYGQQLIQSATEFSPIAASGVKERAPLVGIGQAPTGDKDPFALRRHALGQTQPGSGLGVSIVKRIAELHDIAVRFAKEEQHFPEVRALSAELALGGKPMYVVELLTERDGRMTIGRARATASSSSS